MPGAKLQPNNPANDPDLKPVKGYSKFKPNMSLYKTHTFGLIEPHMAIETVPGDKSFNYRSGTDLDTQNLRSPLMTPVKMHKDTFFVPLTAILPRNHELLITNPLSGDDIIAKDVAPVATFCNKGFGPVVLGGENIMYRRLNGYTGISGTTKYGTHLEYMTNLVHSLFTVYQLCSPFLSYGSLAQSLGYNFAGGFYGIRRTKDKSFMTFDESIDYIIQYIMKYCSRIEVTLNHPVASTSNVTSPVFSTGRALVWESGRETDDYFGLTRYVSFRSILEALNSGELVANVKVTVIDPTSTEIGVSDPDVDVNDARCFTNFSRWFVAPQSGNPDLYLNLSRLIAYQLVCASFYSDDSVDYVYNADLWHSNMHCLIEWCIGLSNLSDIRFNWNGVSKEYDTVCGEVISRIGNRIGSGLNYYFGHSGTYTYSGSQGSLVVSSSFAGFHAAGLEYMLNIFGYQRSLRYRDYFVGSRPRPLAVGDVTVGVNANVVNVVDVTKKIQLQRFLNQVNRVGRRIREYTAGIFGVAAPSTHQEPIYLSSITTSIGAEETSNTGANQLVDAQTTTSKLRKDTSNFVFSTDFSEFGVVIGVTYFDAVRAYVDGLDKTLTHVDRFDMFNPYLQHIGDQELNNMEINPEVYGPLGYKLRYSEYKQRTDRAAGGFVGRTYLPGFSFPVGLNDLMNNLSNDPTTLVISPDFIRTKPHEFDKFFNVLDTYSPAGYFHFIIRHDNEVDVQRPMEAAPSIL